MKNEICTIITRKKNNIRYYIKRKKLHQLNYRNKLTTKCAD